MYIYYDKVSNIIDITRDYDSKAEKKLLGQEILKRFKEQIATEPELKYIFPKENEKEQQSWKNSIPELLSVIKKSGLANLYVVFEYCLPVGKNRIDCTIIGRNRNDELCILIVELKQWTKIYDEADNENPCRVKLNADDIEREHPLAQIQTYSRYLENNHSFCENSNVKIYRCAYMHNFEDKRQLFKEPYNIYKNDFYDWTFTKHDVDDFKIRLNEIFINESKFDDVEQFVNGEYTTGKNGLEELHNILESKSAIILLEEQRDIISLFSKALKNSNKNERIVEVISGSVGSGKTYLAFEMLKRVIDKFENKNCFYTLINATVRDVIEGTFNNKIALYTDTVANMRSTKYIVIIDEAHRISNVNETLSKLLRNTKIVIIFQDDTQRILLSEEGTRDNYEQAIDELTKYYTIKRLGKKGEKLKLKTDLRTNARSGFIANLNKFLSDEEIEESTYINKFYNLNVMNNLNDIDIELKNKDKNYQCKWVAPFCWEWTRNTKINDIVIEGFEKAWNPSRDRNDVTKQYNWYQKLYEHHLDEVGCIYTVQGLDFDYTATIFWDDLYWKDGKWNVDLNKIKDQYYLISDLAKKYGGIADKLQKDGHWIVRYNNYQYDIHHFIKIVSEERGIDLHKEVIQIIKNIYRVLLSRAKEGMYVWFKDEETKTRFIKAFNL
ncbi:DNA/RNA helicase domain-containing protein [Clostridium botulinum]|uniref:DNA/RNA helicase domain-containing protein n=1 Tax=Clostridium botulinum TaxID=1491 RepID=UPI001967D160|nr:DNA/RNA helicase domain-containing protein [Clostridium botulinum]MBN1060200.1 DUF2075 domain-containing protein [Clostridium botulinum]